MDPGKIRMMTPSLPRAARFLAALLTLTAWAAWAAVAPPRRRAPGNARKPAASSGIQYGKALQPFLASLSGLDAPGPEGTVRVLQFGDSHTAADYWSGEVRRRLQARFGDGGFGCLLSGRPWRGYSHEGVRILSGVHWPAQSLRSTHGDGLVGLPGASVAPEPGQAFALQAPFAAYRVQVLGPGEQVVQGWTEPLEADPDAQPSTAAAQAANPVLPAANPVPLARLGSDPVPGGRVLETFGQDGLPPDTPRKLGLFLPDSDRLLGVELFSGHPGVVYDELGLNGAEILDLAKWNPELRRTLLARARPDLLVLAYGTNDMGRSLPDQAGYREAVRDLLLELRRESGAPILVVGPLDRLGVNKRQRAALKAGAAWVIQALQSACLEAGCAFWDARQAMGGYGAMLKWRRAGLAQPDLVHLNGAGYRKLGDLMVDQLLASYPTRRAKNR
jgi:lysophospholipase L1-like esterase